MRNVFDANVILKCLHGGNLPGSAEEPLSPPTSPNQRGTPGAVRLRHTRSDKQPSESLVRGALDVAAGGSLGTALLDHSEQGFSFLLGF